MPVRLAVTKEVASGEKRVAIDPGVACKLGKMGLEVILERNAGFTAHFHDEDYDCAQVMDDHSAALAEADIVAKVGMPSEQEIEALREGTILIGTLFPYNNPERVKQLRDKKITSFSMELVPRISRAQSMDVLSSQATVAGYKAAIMGADLCARFFPMLTTAAGTIRPAKCVVIGVGVAGLQAIATARRLGAIVEAYDVRSATKEQVESLGAKFIELSITAEGEGGYARELSDDEKRQQQKELAQYIAAADVVISTAAIPGRPAPKIINTDTIEAMKPGSVIIDLAAESGGNAELTEPGKTIEHDHVIIHGPLNVPSQTPLHASEMYAKNIMNFLGLVLKEGELSIDWDDEIIKGCVLTHDGEIKNEAIRNHIEGAGA